MKRTSGVGCSTEGFAPVAKIDTFSLNPRPKLMLGQETYHLDLRAIMDESRVLMLDLGHSDSEAS